ERKHTVYLRSLIISSAPEEGSDDWSGYRQADLEFHTFLTSLLEDSFLTRQLDALQGIMSVSFAQGLLRPPHETVGEHIEIIDALEARDQDRAERAMLGHIRTTIALMRQKAAHTDG